MGPICLGVLIDALNALSGCLDVLLYTFFHKKVRFNQYGNFLNVFTIPVSKRS